MFQTNIQISKARTDSASTELEIIFRGNNYTKGLTSEYAEVRGKEADA